VNSTQEGELFIRASQCISYVVCTFL